MLTRTLARDIIVAEFENSMPQEVYMCRTSIYDARNNFSALVKMAEEGELVELTRYDKPVAVIISYAEYEEVQNKQPSLLDKLAALKKEYADVVDNVGFDLNPSRESPDYSKNPWA